MTRRFGRGRALGLLCVAAIVTSCGRTTTAPGTIGPPRTWRMGFSGIPPRADVAVLLQNIDLWSLRSDAAIISEEAPWDSLLAGVAPDGFVKRQRKALVDYYRAKGLDLWIYLDPANGLDRGGESDKLLAAGRSITEPDIQQLYRSYAVALDTLLHPSVFGVVLETNLIRTLAPGPLYAAIRQVANDAAADLRARDATVRLSASVQVETAWGLLPPGVYQGADADFADFPFIQVLGLSSYPYFAWSDPDSIPLGYYARLVSGRSVPVGVTEGGWSSRPFGSVTTSAEMQRRYISRQAALLDAARAVAVFQLTFADFDLPTFPPATANALLPFAYLGLVDSSLSAKPALAAWDAAFRRPR